MLKTLRFLFVLISLSATALAQGTRSIDPFQECCMPGINAKTNATQYRMVGESRYVYNTSTAMYDFVDSSYYQYSSGRGGDVQRGLKYDTSVYQTTQAATNKIRTSVVYDTAGRPVEVYEDVWYNTVWYNVRHRVIHYNPAGQPLQDTTYVSHTFGTPPIYAFEAYTYSYNTAGKLVQALYYDFADGDLPTTDTTYTYNSAGLLIEKLTIDKWGGNDGKHREDYTYNSLGQRTATDHYQWPDRGTGWSLSQQTYNWYNIGGQLIRQVLLNATVVNYDSVEALVISYDANGNHSQTIGMFYTGTEFVNLYLHQYMYNINNQLVYFNTQLWNRPAQVWMDADYTSKEYYYYQEYDPATVAKLAQSGGKLNLHPVPANNTLNIDVQWDDEQSYSYIVADMQGKILMQGSSNQQKQVLDVAALPAGAYNLILKGDKGGVQHSKFTVMK